MVLPIIMIIMIGAVEMGWAYRAFISVASASRDATRNGASLTNQDICSIVTAETNLLTGQKQLLITRNTNGASSNQTIDTMNVPANSSTCSCTDGIQTGTSSGHASPPTSADRYMQVELRYTHSMFLGFNIPALPQQWPMYSMSRFPVPTYYTTFNNTASC